MFTLVNLLFCHAWLIQTHSCDRRANPVTCLHVALLGGCHSRVVAPIHLITVDAGLQLGCCGADAGLLLNGCGISPRAACKLLLSCCQTASRLLPRLAAGIEYTLDTCHVGDPFGHQNLTPKFKGGGRGATTSAYRGLCVLWNPISTGEARLVVS